MSISHYIDEELKNNLINLDCSVQSLMICRTSFGEIIISFFILKSQFDFIPNRIENILLFTKTSVFSFVVLQPCQAFLIFASILFLNSK